MSQLDLSHAELTRAARLSVAPMMDWTDRHCRYLHRLLSGQALLYTEMVTAPALVRGGALHLLDHNTNEHPVALQLGGSDPKELAAAAKLGADAGYDAGEMTQLSLLITRPDASACDFKGYLAPDIRQNVVF